MAGHELIRCGFSSCDCLHFWAVHYLDQDTRRCFECDGKLFTPPEETVLRHKTMTRVDVEPRVGINSHLRIGYRAIVQTNLVEEEKELLEDYAKSLSSHLLVRFRDETVVEDFRDIARAMRRYYSPLEIYQTSFCNFGHNTADGVPIEHECYVIPPTILEAEKRGEYDLCHTLMRGWVDRKRHTGRKR